MKKNKRIRKTDFMVLKCKSKIKNRRSFPQKIDMKKTFVISILLIFIFSCKSNNKDNFPAPEKLNDSIEVSTLENEGIDTVFISNLIDSIEKGIYPNIHSLLILRNNKLVFERYFSGEDAIAGKGKVGLRHHQVDSVHDIRSITKSIIGLAILIAYDKGLIKSLDEPVFNYFPEFKQYKTDTKGAITIRHLLTMRHGLDWNEKISYSDTTNSEIQMNRSNDPIDYFLSKKTVNPPGTVFNYSGGCPQTLAAIIKKQSGLEIDEFVAQTLFKQLGISTFEWIKGKHGLPYGASGLRMRSRDLAKIGLLYLNEGKWNEDQLIPSKLINEAQQLQVNIEPDFGYGYQVWIPTDTIKGRPFTTTEASGNGGQIIAINKTFNTVIVITAGNYNRRDMTWVAPDLYVKYIYPAIQ